MLPLPCKQYKLLSFLLVLGCEFNTAADTVTDIMRNVALADLFGAVI